MAASSPAAPFASTLSMAALRKSFLLSSLTTPRPRSRSRHRLRAGSVKQWREFEDDAGAVKEWREFEDAVRRKDLSRALRFLQSVEPQAGAAAMQVAVPVPPGRDWEVLDTCIDADDMRLVGRRTSSSPTAGSSPASASARTSVCWDAIANLTRKLNLAWSSVQFASHCLYSGFVEYDNSGRTKGSDTNSFEGDDRIGGLFNGLPNTRCHIGSICGITNGHSGPGTQFWDEKMEKELAEGHLSSTAFDRYCMVLFAGIAAEALVYGEAEGGENDENLFRSLCILLDPPLSVAQCKHTKTFPHNNIVAQYYHIHDANKMFGLTGRPSQLEAGGAGSIYTESTDTDVSALNSSASLDESKLKLVFCTYKGLRCTTAATSTPAPSRRGTTSPRTVVPHGERQTWHKRRFLASAPWGDLLRVHKLSGSMEREVVMLARRHAWPRRRRGSAVFWSP
ncbi:hypothetical protein PR202_ga06576 [Eleusine coracana subsp. coracana]|uniref:Uncharacterized protein n=1 Tax=Eleusine coracana subsp. coracana TaxID=191504 RepID=A0AAV5BYT0_ELECO|nr:hypothetical protein PR202_ga06576 [Eleusine coracana subsp. coracana]